MPVFAAMLRDESVRECGQTGAPGSGALPAAYEPYRRGTFAARWPAAHLYTPGHAWLARSGDAGNPCWRVGLTKFALRMLGELVELQFTVKDKEAVQPGDILGTLEGFKALSDVYCVGRGSFLGANPALKSDLDLVSRDPHGAGWLYAFAGEPGPGSLDVQGYCRLLDQTIDRLLASEAQEEGTP